jgi:hypothetical protein
MRCPSCDAEVLDPHAAFCSRCGARLAHDESPPASPEPPPASPEPPPAPPPNPPANTDVWAQQRRPRGERARSRPRHSTRERATATLAGLALPLRDLVAALARGVASRGWLEACRAASVAFLTTLCVGALLLVAAKLSSPRLGAGASPLSVLTASAMLGGGALGAPIAIGDVRVAALPLGALGAIGASLAWAASRVVRREEGATARTLAAEGARVGVPYAVLMWASALIFRFRTGATPAAVGAGEVLVLGLLWGALFGALGGVRAHGPLLSVAARPFRRLRERSRSLYLGVQTGAAMLIVAVVAAGAAVLLWIIVALARGAAPPRFGVGDAVGGLLFLVAFLPNVLVSLLALSLGAPVEVGAKVRLGGRALGPVESFSLADWGGGGVPWPVWLLVLIPLVACLLGGFAARRNADDSARLVEVLGAAAVTFAAPLAAAVAVADARLGAGLVKARGFAHIAPDAVMVLVLAAIWAAALGYAGWSIADSQKDEGTASPVSAAAPAADGEATR